MSKPYRQRYYVSRRSRLRWPAKILMIVMAFALMGSCYVVYGQMEVSEYPFATVSGPIEGTDLYLTHSVTKNGDLYTYEYIVSNQSQYTIWLFHWDLFDRVTGKSQVYELPPSKADLKITLQSKQAPMMVQRTFKAQQKFTQEILMSTQYGPLPKTLAQIQQKNGR
ncbi:hypothetical protein KW791_03640 [Candidatus Parcubacteria bacterium]|nr:hypothetical protein [Candidatus Parcubacteria bacterium]